MKNSGTEESKKKSSNEDLKQAIQKRIGELTKEIQGLVQKKQAYQQVMKELDTRLTQLMGAIEELSKLTSDEKLAPETQAQEESDKPLSE